MMNLFDAKYDKVVFAQGSILIFQYDFPIYSVALRNPTGLEINSAAL